jgi:hypothetical protein
MRGQTSTPIDTGRPERRLKSDPASLSSPEGLGGRAPRRAWHRSALIIEPHWPIAGSDAPPGHSSTAAARHQLDSDIAAVRVALDPLCGTSIRTPATGRRRTGPALRRRSSDVRAHGRKQGRSRRNLANSRAPFKAKRGQGRYAHQQRLLDDQPKSGRHDVAGAAPVRLYSGSAGSARSGRTGPARHPYASRAKYRRRLCRRHEGSLSAYFAISLDSGKIFSLSGFFRCGMSSKMSRIISSATRKS